MDISGLVALAGNTLVAAAVTDAWEAARDRFARLFGRGRPDGAAERRLDATRGQLTAASSADLERVRAELAGQWAVRLADLLDEYPDAVAELQVLVEEVQALMRPGTMSATGHSLAAGRDVSISADHGGVAAGVIHGNVGLPGPSPPGPVSG